MSTLSMHGILHQIARLAIRFVSRKFWQEEAKFVLSNFNDICVHLC